MLGTTVACTMDAASAPSMSQHCIHSYSEFATEPLPLSTPENFKAAQVAFHGQAGARIYRSAQPLQADRCGRQRAGHGMPEEGGLAHGNRFVMILPPGEFKPACCAIATV